MSKALASLLGQPEQQLAEAVVKLEELSGYNSEDVRLVAEVRQAVRQKLASLGLDPDDTSSEELYHGLVARLHKDLEHLNRFVGGKDATRLSSHLLTVYEHAPLQRRVWALRQTTAKDILRTNPPKRLQKQLHYRSLESMLKREQPALLFAGALSIESASWQKLFWRQMEKLSPSDFEDRDVQILDASAAKWQSLAPKHALITMVPQLGAAVIWPAQGPLHKAGLGLSLFIFQAVEMLRDISSNLKLHQLEPEFGKNAIAAWQKGKLSEVGIGPKQLSWPAIRQHLAHQPDSAALSTLASHLQIADVAHRQPAVVAGELWPSLNWWADGGNLAAAGEHPAVGLNMLDALQNYISGSMHGRHSSAISQKSLWDKLACRYMDHTVVENYVLDKLGGSEEAAFDANVNTKTNPSLRELTQLLQAV